MAQRRAVVLVRKDRVLDLEIAWSAARGRALDDSELLKTGVCVEGAEEKVMLGSARGRAAAAKAWDGSFLNVHFLVYTASHLRYQSPPSSRW